MADNHSGGQRTETGSSSWDKTHQEWTTKQIRTYKFWTKTQEVNPGKTNSIQHQPQEINTQKWISSPSCVGLLWGVRRSESRHQISNALWFFRLHNNTKWLKKKQSSKFSHTKKNVIFSPFFSFLPRSTCSFQFLFTPDLLTSTSCITSSSPHYCLRPPSSKPSDNTQEVTLTKNASGLGFSFLMCELDPPTRDFGSLVRIKQLFPDQPAQQSGRIQEGDVLLAINGQALKELSYPVCADFKWIEI